MNEELPDQFFDYEHYLVLEHNPYVRHAFSIMMYICLKRNILGEPTELPYSASLVLCTPPQEWSVVTHSAFKSIANTLYALYACICAPLSSSTWVSDRRWRYLVLNKQGWIGSRTMFLFRQIYYMSGSEYVIANTLERVYSILPPLLKQTIQLNQGMTVL